IPFLMDSVRMELNRQELTAHTILHGIFCVERNEHGNLVKFVPRSEGPCTGVAEGLMYFEVDRHNDQIDLDKLRDGLDGVLGEVRVAVADYDPMRDRALALIDELAQPPAKLPQQEVA